LAQGREDTFRAPQSQLLLASIAPLRDPARSIGMEALRETETTGETTGKKSGQASWMDA
jgi:hypothetical protein